MHNQPHEVDYNVKLHTGVYHLAFKTLLSTLNEQRYGINKLTCRIRGTDTNMHISQY